MDVRDDKCRFAVVIQWGSGHIYFQSFHKTEEEAQLTANRQDIWRSNEWRTRSKGKKGAKPHVMVWERKSVGVQLIESKDSGEDEERAPEDAPPAA